MDGTLGGERSVEGVVGKARRRRERRGGEVSGTQNDKIGNIRLRFRIFGVGRWSYCVIPFPLPRICS